jgi:3-deoxy-D-manno-octulosonic-acid transferase
VAARDEASAEAFRRLGAPDVHLGGNLKADLPAPGPLHAGWTGLRCAWAGSPILVAGNSVEGEEDLLLEAWSSARTSFPGLRLILAPRQPRRFDVVAGLLSARDCAFRRASLGWPGEEVWRGLEVLLLDTLGELSAAYAEGTLALVAGGWRATGGHNPLEPVRAGVPTLIGPGFQNFEDLAEPLLQVGAIEVVPAEELASRILAALAAAPLRPTGVGLLPPSLSGALDRTWDLIGPFLPTAR